MKTVFAFLSASVVACVAVAGCTAPTSSSESTGSNDQALNAALDRSPIQVISNPGGVDFVDIQANGSGCPTGTWSASISDDHQAFTMTFDSYEADLNPGQFIALKDCQVRLKVHTPGGFSFSVGEFSYAGYAALDSDGMTAKQEAKYYFQGEPQPVIGPSTTIQGPYSDDYVFTDEVPVADLVWSPCGAERDLNIVSRLVLTNNPGKTGSAYMNTLSLDGQIHMVFHFNFNWRTC